MSNKMKRRNKEGQTMNAKTKMLTLSLIAVSVLTMGGCATYNSAVPAGAGIGAGAGALIGFGLTGNGLGAAAGAGAGALAGAVTGVVIDEYRRTTSSEY
jgi:uncharacterized membrane protein